jgi:hypothetical protein
MQSSSITTALFLSLVMVFIAVMIGTFIRNKIWNKSKVVATPLDFARTWSAYIAAIVPVASIHNYFKVDAGEATVRFLVLIVVFPLIAGGFGWIYGWFKLKTFSNLNFSLKSNPPSTYDGSDEHFELALTEINTGTTKTSTWARAMAQSGGEEAKTKATYIQLRVAELANSNITSIVQIDEHVNLTDTNSKNPNSGFSDELRIAIVALVVIALFTSIYLVSSKVEVTSTNELQSSSNNARPSEQPKEFLWTKVFIKNPDNFFALDTVNIKKQGEFAYAWVGYDVFDPTRKLNVFWREYTEFNCSIRSLRPLKYVQHERSFQNGLGRIIDSGELNVPPRTTVSIMENIAHNKAMFNKTHEDFQLMFVEKHQATLAVIAKICD